MRRSSDWQFILLALSMMIVMQLVGPEYFRFQSDWRSEGDWWRVLSGHWVHVGWIHLLLNALGLIICVSITTPNWSLKYWCLITAIIGIGISLLFTWRHPELNWYVGFSGILFGLYLLAALRLYRHDRLIAILIIMAITGKVLTEQIGAFDFTSADLIGAPVIVEAHLYGLSLAIAIALISGGYTMYDWLNQQSKE
jgi:rhomboid family GlyGly-CTERM serine protease